VFSVSSYRPPARTRATARKGASKQARVPEAEHAAAGKTESIVQLPAPAPEYVMQAMRQAKTSWFGVSRKCLVGQLGDVLR
jgi:hypothetical protein